MSHPNKLPAHHAVAFSAFMVEFVGESDRAAVILGASKIEHLLGEILDKFLLPTPSSIDDLLEGDAPLSTFSARIKACHRLGIIDDQFAKLLNTFRKLRNGFAHEVTSNSLSTGSARDRVSAMAEPMAQSPLFHSLLDRISGEMNRAPSDQGVIFRVVLAIFHIHLVGLHYGLLSVQRQSMKTMLELCGSDWPKRAATAEQSSAKSDG